MEASQASEAGSIPVARSTSRLAERRAVLLCHLPARAAIPAKYRLHLRICGGAGHHQEQHTCAEAPCQSPSAQSVVHLAHNTPFSAFFTEVVCSLSTASGAPTAKRGGVTTIDPRHAGDTPTETFYDSNSPRQARGVGERLAHHVGVRTPTADARGIGGRLAHHVDVRTPTADAPCQSPSAQSVVHLAHNTPFSAFFTEVVCSLSTVSGAPTAKRGELLP